MRKVSLLGLLFALFLSFTDAHAALGTNRKDSTSMNEETAKADFKRAAEEFKSLSKKERRLRIKDAKVTLKQYKTDRKAGKAADDNTVLLVILAILLPPLAVYLHQGEINSKFWISLLLTLLFWIPGAVYAVLVVLGEA